VLITEAECLAGKGVDKNGKVTSSQKRNLQKLRTVNNSIGMGTTLRAEMGNSPSHNPYYQIQKVVPNSVGTAKKGIISGRSDRGFVVDLK